MNSPASRNFRLLGVFAIGCFTLLAISTWVLNRASMNSERTSHASPDVHQGPAPKPRANSEGATAVPISPSELDVNAGADQLLGRMRDIARRTAAGYGPQVLRELQHFPISTQTEVLVALWREGFAEVGEALQEIAITCAAHANAVASGYRGPEYARFLGAFAENSCREVLKSHGARELAETASEIQRRWQSEPPQAAVDSDPNAEPYTAEEHTALLGRSSHESELTLRMTAAMSASPEVLLRPETLANFVQLPQARRAHIAQASAVLASCTIFGLCSASSIAAFDFCTSPGVACAPGESLDTSVRRNLSSVDFQIALDAVNRASDLRELHARTAGRTGP